MKAVLTCIQLDVQNLFSKSLTFCILIVLFSNKYLYMSDSAKGQLSQNSVFLCICAKVFTQLVLQHFCSQLIAKPVEFCFHILASSLSIFWPSAESLFLFALFLLSVADTKSKLINPKPLKKNKTELLTSQQCDCPTSIYLINVELKNIYEFNRLIMHSMEKYFVFLSLLLGYSLRISEFF